MIKVGIFGGAGFIGSHLCALLDTKKEIEYVIYDLKNGQDIRNKQQLDKFFTTETLDAVIILSALAGVAQGEEFYEEYTSTNIVGTQNIVNYCKKYKVDNVIFYSSSSVLGGCTTALEIKEGLHESCDYNPKGVYGVSKVSGEFIIRNSGLNYLILRPFTVVGLNGRKDMVIYKWLNLIKRNEPIIFYGDGETRRTYTPVEDLTKATLDCIIELVKKDNIFKLENKRILHIAGAEQISLKEVYEIFLEYFSKKKMFIDAKKLPVQNFDIEISCADISLAKKLIGYNPQHKFKDCLLEILKEEIK